MYVTLNLAILFGKLILINTQRSLAPGKRALYGPGAYVTQRPAIGNVHLEYSYCKKFQDNDENVIGRTGVLGLNVFMPYYTLLNMMHFNAKAVRNGEWKDGSMLAKIGLTRDKWHHGAGDEAERLRRKLSCKPRRDWGLYSNTILAAVKDRQHAIDELVL
jgi:hypothetical protein